MLPRTLLAVALLAAAPVALAPTAAADSCAAVYLETLTCTPVYVFYCGLYGVEFNNGIKDVTVHDVPGCVVNVAVNCVKSCLGDVVLP